MYTDLNLKFQTTLLPDRPIHASNITFRPHVLLHVREVAICDLKDPHPRARRLSKVQRVSRIFPRQINAE